MTETDPPPIPDPTRAILDSITDGVSTVDTDFRITSFNQRAIADLGVIAGMLGEHAEAFVLNRVGRHQNTPFVGSVLDEAPVFPIGVQGGVRGRRVDVGG